ncbi:unnamed protein product [Amaranthus hypochondriacus]
MGRIMENVVRSVSKVAEDDPRRVIHSMKVGLAVTLVSLLYFFQPLFHDFGTSTLWAVLTVVVVFEYSVGATLGKGLNRVMATLLGGILAVGVHGLATQCGHIAEPLLISIFVFLQAALSTFARFSPKIKARYDYGFLIFILTFAFISVSGFRLQEIIDLARNRWATIVIGVFSSLLISIFVFPVWAGQDLHNLIANNIDKLANSLEGYGNSYFKIQENANAQDIEASMLQTYKTVLNTKSTEEILANFARWEPSHGAFRFKHPWNQYLNLGALTRECAYRIDNLHKQLDTNFKKILKFDDVITEECNKITLQASKTLKELSTTLKNTSQSTPCIAHQIAESKHKVKSLQEVILKSMASLSADYEKLQVVTTAITIATIFTDILNYVEKMVDCNRELALLAKFKQDKSPDSESKNDSSEFENSGSLISIENRDNNVNKATFVNSSQVVAITIE